jgi:hypothetical protein
MAAGSPTARSLKHLRDAGCIAQVVERWNAFGRVRVDLFEVIDIVALSPEGETIGVQSCALSSVSKRVDKITECEALAALRKCGWRLLVHGWGKGANGRYRLREVDLS